MRIRNNILSMNIFRNYSQHASNIARLMGQIASGSRINSAADDAAGLCISEKMRAQIRGLNAASKNCSDAVSLVRTAEGALGEAQSILQRMNELAVNAATGTMEELDRRAAAKEFEQLKRELNDISSQTTFNNLNLLDGSMSYEGQIRSAETSGINTTKGTKIVDGQEVATTTVEIDAVKLKAGDTVSLKLGEDTFEYTLERDYTSAGTVLNGLKNADGKTLAEFGASLPEGQEVQVKNGAVLVTGLDVDTSGFKPGEPSTEATALRIQSGPLENQQLSINIGCVNTAALGLDGINLEDQDSAGRAITAVKAALNKVSDERTTMGAMENRLNYKISNLQTQSLNLADAESRIRDVDMAKAITELVREQILMQVSTAMLAQANALQQNVLSLLW